MLRVLLLLLAFLLLCYWCITKHSPMIEKDVLTQVNTSLFAENQHDNIKATIDGRDIVLTGQVNSEEERKHILDTVRQSVGVRTVEHTLALTPKPFPVPETDTIIQETETAPEPVVTETPEPEQTVETETIVATEPEITTPEPEAEVEPEEPAVETVYIEPGLPLSQLSINISKESKQINFSGYLADDSDKQALLQQINDQFQINNNLKTTKLDANWPTAWTDVASSVLKQVLKLDNGLATIKPNQIVITGNVTDHKMRDLIEKQLRQSLPASWAIDFSIDIPLSENSVACETEIQNLLNQETINFTLGSAEISSESTQLLDSIIDNIKTCEQAKFLVVGHTDYLGNKKYNQELSEWRAEAVKDYLVYKGISAQRITTKGYGETRPIAPNSTIEGRSQNRRIEFVVLGESQ